MNAGVLTGKLLPRGPPPESYTERDMVRFLRSFSSDHEAWTLENEDQNNVQVRQILSEMDGSLDKIALRILSRTGESSIVDGMLR